MRGTRRVAAVASALIIGGVLALPAMAQSPASSPTSPVNLATRVDFGAARAARQAIVTAGDARFEVLGDGLIRMEYSPSGTFEDAPTVNVLNRRFAVPFYRVSSSGGWLTIRTSEATLRYRLGSGPFGPDNTSVQVPGSSAVSPQWQNECPFNQVCDAGAAQLVGPANIQTDHSGYQSIAGFVANLGQGNQAGANWTVLGAPAGQAVVTLRYANYLGALGGPAPRTIDLVVNGSDVQTLTLPATSSWDDWSTVTANVSLNAGNNTVGVECAAADSCNVNVDTLSVSAPNAPAPVEPAMNYLGGYTRGFDTATYGSGYSCPAGTPTAAQCTAALPEMHPGILDQAGYRLLDDTDSAVWTSNGWVAPRTAGGDVEDGYLFVYGHDYAQALQDLNRLTGPSPLLPEYLFGVWYSDYYPYTTSDYENTLIPDFRANQVPIDTLSVDTDWKAPNQWDGWEWNPALFPYPQEFLTWAATQGIHVTLNIHASIADDDPQLAATQALAGTSLADDNSCFTPSGMCKVWDWSSIPQAESYFALHQPFESQGVSFWWLDWCCDSSTASDPGVTPDAWINHLYAQELINRGQRGFVLSRTGSSYQNPDEVYPAGPWAGHTSTLAFTGDTWGTWNTLAFQVHLAADESSIDEPYVSDDIGSFLGQPPGIPSGGPPSDDPDIYARWVQLGAFQPILRLHSSAGNRLPWDYPQPADSISASFLRLREALVPYTYTLAAQSVSSGLPINRPLYLDYPGQAAAYSNPGEYLYGPDVLVAPVTTPGTVSTESVWFPPGHWTDWFTGATFTGPSEQTLTVPLDRMPVFVQDGGIVPEQVAMEHVGARPDAPTILRVYPGAPGGFSLYQDAGSGNGYEHGQDSHTVLTTWSSRAGRATNVAIGPAVGRYPGQASTRSFTVQIERVSAPDRVLLDGRRLGPGAWSYHAATDTVVVHVDGLPLRAGAVVSEIGGTAVSSPEPAAVDLSIDPSTPLSLAAGASTTVTTTEHNAGPGSARGLSVSLGAPAGWTVTPASPVAAGDLAEGASGSQSWTVTAPSGASSPVTGTLVSHVRYRSAGRSESVTASEQGPPAPAPPPPPVITSTAPPSPAPGDSVTLTGQNFGDTQGSSYLTLAQGGTSWGAPYDGAKVTITSWSDTSITFGLPPDSEPFPLLPGQPATITVTVVAPTGPETSTAVTLNIAGTAAPAPSITSVSPSTTTAGSTVTLSGTNFGASQGSSYLTLVQGGTSWGAPNDGAKLTIPDWSDGSITFALPPDNGSFPLQPGTATVTVTVAGQASNSETITITS
ncbi:MAG: TIM-barrel domain-containing protein [Solirubrobacteraceae bacterium]